MSTKEKIQDDVLIEDEVQDNYQLILYNDDVTTFDIVINSLMEICGFDSIQSEQIALIVHTKGKCSVKEGSYSELEVMCFKFLSRLISAKVE